MHELLYGIWAHKASADVASSVTGDWKKNCAVKRLPWRALTWQESKTRSALTTLIFQQCPLMILIVAFTNKSMSGNLSYALCWLSEIHYEESFDNKAIFFLSFVLSFYLTPFQSHLHSHIPFEMTITLKKSTVLTWTMDAFFFSPSAYVTDTIDMSAHLKEPSKHSPTLWLTFSSVFPQLFLWIRAYIANRRQIICVYETPENF